MQLLHFLGALAVVMIWGGNVAVGKVAVMQIPALSFLVIRFTLTVLVLLPFARLRGADMRALAKIAVSINVFHYGFIFASMALLEASTLTLVMQSQVVFGMIGGVLVFKEKMNLRSIGGLLLSFAGLVVIFGLPQTNMIGILLALGGCVAWAIGNMQMKKLPQIHLMTFMTFTTLFSIPFLALLSWVVEKDALTAIEQADWYSVSAVLLYQIILCTVAMMLWQRLVAHNPIQKIMPVTLLQPLFGVLGGVLLFDEILSQGILFGGLLTMAGVALIIYTPQEKTQ